MKGNWWEKQFQRHQRKVERWRERALAKAREHLESARQAQHKEHLTEAEAAEVERRAEQDAARFEKEAQRLEVEAQRYAAEQERRAEEHARRFEAEAEARAYREEMHAEMREHWREQRQRWREHRDEWRARHRWHRKHIGQELREYYGAHLHRRIFFWFLASIGATVALVWLVSAVMHWRSGGPPRLVIIGLAAFALFKMSGKIARRIARPLYELVKVTGEIGRGNFAARAPERGLGIDEIATLSRAVNDMAERIERQIAGQRELLAAVSHELRTPLARLRILLDIARERGATEQVFHDWERELIEMDQLVGELLASARLDFQAISPAPLDAVDVARRALDRAGLPADRLHAETSRAPFNGDPTLIGRALANLIDNAHKHGRGLTRFTVAAPPGKVVFALEDKGPGIPPALAERVFQPFVSGPAAPSTDHASENAGMHSSLGLGLALVARIARAHGGRVFCEPPTSGVGARLVLELPLVPRATPPASTPAAA